MTNDDKIAYLTQMIDQRLRMIHEQRQCVEMIRADIWSWQQQLEGLRNEQDVL